MCPLFVESISSVDLYEPDRHLAGSRQPRPISIHAAVTSPVNRKLCGLFANESAVPACPRCVVVDSPLSLAELQLRGSDRHHMRFDSHHPVGP